MPVTKMNKASVSVLALVALGCGPEAVHGLRALAEPELIAVGPAKTQLRTVGPFRQLKAGRAFKIRFQNGSRRRLQLRAPANLFPILKTQVRGDTLELEATRSYRSKEPIVVTITNPRLSAVHLSGASTASVARLNERDFHAHLRGAARLSVHGSARELLFNVRGAGRVEVKGTRSQRIHGQVKGAGHLTASGITDVAELEVSGAGRVDLAELIVRRVQIDGSGAGHVSMRSAQELQVDGSGAFRASYSGSPRLRTKLSGVAKVSRR